MLNPSLKSNFPLISASAKSFLHTKECRSAESWNRGGTFFFNIFQPMTPVFKVVSRPIKSRESKHFSFFLTIPSANFSSLRKLSIPFFYQSNHTNWKNIQFVTDFHFRQICFRKLNMT